MATKTELIAQLEALLREGEPETKADDVEALKTSYEALIAAAEDSSAQEGADEDSDTANTASDGAASNTTVPIESATLQDEEDKRFKQLLDTYNQHVNDLRRKRAKEEADNLAAKQEVMTELRSVISEEENIGTAFQRFKDLQEKWKSIGTVPGQAYRDLQQEYTQLLDEFFYHIRIYKELRDHDLRKNTGLKQALISDMSGLVLNDNIKELEQGVKDYQEKWHQIGPVLKEEWEAIRDGFHAATRAVYDKIHEHYRIRREEHEANLEAKRSLVEKVKELVNGLEASSAKEWHELTDKVLELQGAWKTIGFATKKDNERVWKEFRQECNAFFAKKKVYFDGLKSQYKEARDKKQALLDQAIELKDSTEWRQTADKLKSLQEKWKQVGSAGPRDEHRLWNKFREACDTFFNARKANFKQQDAEHAVGVKEREALLSEITAFAHTGDRNADVAALKAFSKRWLECGRVSPRQFGELMDKYRALMDSHFEKLKLEDDERRKMQYQGHLDDLKSAPDARDRMDREQRIVKRKIEELELEMRQMEGNMGMFNFKSAAGEAMRKEMEKKVERTKREVERLKAQHRELLKVLK